MDRKSVLLDLVEIARPLDEVLVDLRRLSFDHDTLSSYLSGDILQRPFDVMLMAN